MKTHENCHCFDGSGVFVLCCLSHTPLRGDGGVVVLGGRFLTFLSLPSVILFLAMADSLQYSGDDSHAAGPPLYFAAQCPFCFQFLRTDF